MIDPHTIPATPVYTITLSSSGKAAIDGEEIDHTGTTIDEARVAALAEVRIKAALHGRPVRALAKEHDGAAWPLIVSPDGQVTTLDQPHPTPAPTPVQTPPAPRSAPPAKRPTSTAAAGNPPPHGEFTVTYAPPPWMPSEQAIVGHAKQERAQMLWAEPLPSEPTYRLQWAQLVQQEQAGALVEAVITAHRIETTLAEAQEFGPNHPHTINMMTVRAWLTLRVGAEAELAETIELLVDTAERRREAAAQPEEDTARLARNAHALWRRLAGEDPESARELAERLLVLLVAFDDGLRAGDVIRWVESGGTARGAA